MEPITFSIELELGQVILSLVGLALAWWHHKDRKAERHQKERHHRENLAAYKDQATAEGPGLPSILRTLD